MKKRYCFECGAEVFLQVNTHPKIFRIGNTGNIINEASHNPSIAAVCSNNPIHMTDDITGINHDWIDEFEKEIKSLI